MEDDAPRADGGWMAKWRQWLLSAGLRAIDAASAFLSRARGRLDASASGADEAGDRGRKSDRTPRHAVAPELVAPPKPRRLLRFFILVLVLIAGTIAGAAFSYRLLSKTINSNSATIEYLNDELAQMKMQESRDLKQIEKSQTMIRDYDNAIIAHLKALEESRAEVEELRHQLSAVKSVRKDSASRNGGGGPSATATGRQPLPRKVGICTMDSAKDAASLAQCIEQFNRK